MVYFFLVLTLDNKGNGIVERLMLACGTHQTVFQTQKFHFTKLGIAIGCIAKGNNRSRLKMRLKYRFVISNNISKLTTVYSEPYTGYDFIWCHNGKMFYEIIKVRNFLQNGLVDSGFYQCFQ